MTIHEIDDQLDHGPIIAQRECAIESWDSSGSVYARLMDIERELVLEHFDAIRDGSYTAKSPATEGNLNLKGFRTTPAARPERARNVWAFPESPARVDP